MRRVIFSSTVLCLCFTATVSAQETGNPAVLSPDTKGAEVGKPDARMNTVDQIVLRQAAIGGMAEIELGKLAAQRAQSDAVKQFAQRMVDDHGQANQRVARLAKAGDVPLPKAPDPDQRAVRAQLEKLTGAQFDVAYMAAQVGDHQKTAHLLEHVITGGQNPDTKAFAIETLPTVLKHLEMAKQIHASLVQVPLRAGEDPVTRR
jgi:putative membrane protein